MTTIYVQSKRIFPEKIVRNGEREIPTCQTCLNCKICVRPVGQDNCLLHSHAREYFFGNFQTEQDDVLDEVLSLLDKLYWGYECEPQPSVEFEEGACSALKHAFNAVKALRNSKTGMVRMTKFKPNPDKIIPRDVFFQIVGVLARYDGFIILKKADGMKWAEKLMSESKDYVTITSGKE